MSEKLPKNQSEEESAIVRSVSQQETDKDDISKENVQRQFEELNQWKEEILSKYKKELSEESYDSVEKLIEMEYFDKVWDLFNRAYHKSTLEKRITESV